MWTHNKKFIMAESLGTGVVPVAVAMGAGSLWGGWIRKSGREAECCRKSPEVHLLKVHPTPPAG